MIWNPLSCISRRIWNQIRHAFQRSIRISGTDFDSSLWLESFKSDHKKRIRSVSVSACYRMSVRVNDSFTQTTPTLVVYTCYYAVYKCAFLQFFHYYYFYQEKDNNYSVINFFNNVLLSWVHHLSVIFTHSRTRCLVQWRSEFRF